MFTTTTTKDIKIARRYVHGRWIGVEKIRARRVSRREARIYTGLIASGRMEFEGLATFTPRARAFTGRDIA